jgi:hypothetical protein
MLALRLRLDADVLGEARLSRCQGDDLHAAGSGDRDPPAVR